MVIWISNPLYRWHLREALKTQGIIRQKAYSSHRRRSNSQENKDKTESNKTERRHKQNELKPISFSASEHEAPWWPSGKASAVRETDTEIDPRFLRSIQIKDFNIGTLVATLSGEWRYIVSAGIGWTVSVHCDWARQQVWSATLCLSVADRTIVWADSSLRYTRIFLRR